MHFINILPSQSSVFFQLGCVSRLRLDPWLWLYAAALCKYADTHARDGADWLIDCLFEWLTDRSDFQSTHRHDASQWNSQVGTTASEDRSINISIITVSCRWMRPLRIHSSFRYTSQRPFNWTWKLPRRLVNHWFALSCHLTIVSCELMILLFIHIHVEPG